MAHDLSSSHRRRQSLPPLFLPPLAFELAPGCLFPLPLGCCCCCCWGLGERARTRVPRPVARSRSLCICDAHRRALSSSRCSSLSLPLPAPVARTVPASAEDDAPVGEGFHESQGGVQVAVSLMSVESSFPDVLISSDHVCIVVAQAVVQKTSGGRLFSLVNCKRLGILSSMKTTS